MRHEMVKGYMLNGERTKLKEHKRSKKLGIFGMVVITLTQHCNCKLLKNHMDSWDFFLFFYYIFCLHIHIFIFCTMMLFLDY